MVCRLSNSSRHSWITFLIVFLIFRAFPQKKVLYQKVQHFFCGRYVSGSAFAPAPCRKLHACFQVLSATQTKLAGGRLLLVAAFHSANAKKIQADN